MPRKIFLSFLGTNNYLPVCYFPEGSAVDSKTPPVKYVQQGILQHLRPGLTSEDSTIIFLTGEARKNNWLEDGLIDFKTQETIPNLGLEKELEAMQLPCKILDIDISSQSNEDAIWSTFQKVFDCLEKEDLVYLDITHSWRYLPMLGMALLNYAKALKNIEVKAIYYGALEQLGTLNEVRQLPPDQRPVPIMNLASFSELQDWAIAADDFVLNGNAKRLGKLTHKRLVPFLRTALGKDEVANNLREINKHIQELVPLMTTNRGQGIWDFPYQKLQDALDLFSQEQSYVKPLNAVVDQIREKVAGFRTSGVLQWLEGVHWCIQHNLVPQGITQLQEGLLSWLCIYFEQRYIAPVGFFDPSSEEARNLISSAFILMGDNIPENNWRGAAGRFPQITRIIMGDELFGKLSKTYNSLGGVRNDINHGGYTKNMKAAKFTNSLEKYYEGIKEVLNEISLDPPKKAKGLLNISNHPSEKWPADQKKMAIETFGSIQDRAFPNIPPELKSGQLDGLVDKYYFDIRASRPAAVHLMGEMTFTHALVKRLQAAGITCVASTTHRIVEERDGKKVVQFRFVQFREYP